MRRRRFRGRGRRRVMLVRMPRRRSYGRRRRGGLRRRGLKIGYRM